MRGRDEPRKITGPGWEAVARVDREFSAWDVYLEHASKKRPRKGTIYRLRFYRGLGWQAWDGGGEAVTGYRPGKIEELLPVFVEELLALEVEDSLVPPRPQVDYVDMISGWDLRTRLRRLRR